jgi:hypothetical protein
MGTRISFALSALLLCANEVHAFDKFTIDLPVVGISASPGQQLQDAVNDPTNADVRIRLAPGTYQLDPTRLNGGRLVFQPGMEISGANEYVDCDRDGVWDPIGACAGGDFDPHSFTTNGSTTVIDGTLISSALPAPIGAAAVVRMGRDNIISGVTIRAPRRAAVAGSVDVNLTSAGEGAIAVLRDSILEGGQRGVRCNNGAPAVSGIASSALLERNVIRDIQPVPNAPFSFGIQVQNSAATGSSWEVTLRNNRVYAARFGLFIVGNNSRMAETRILSIGNVIHRNELGIWITAGFAPVGGPPGDAANDNQIYFVSNKDRIEDNVSPTERLAAFMDMGGGLVALAAGRDTVTAGACSRNQVRLQLLGTTFRGNRRVDDVRNLTVNGSLSSAAAGPEVGTENQVHLLMRRTSGEGGAGAFVFDDSAPDDFTGSNLVRVIGSDVAFELANPDVESPLP